MLLLIALAIHKNTRSNNSTFFVDHKNFDDPKKFDDPNNFVDVPLPNQETEDEAQRPNLRRVIFPPINWTKFLRSSGDTPKTTTEPMVDAAAAVAGEPDHKASVGGRAVAGPSPA